MTRRASGGFAAFLRAETTGGLLLVGATVAALVWANVAPGAYHAAWSTPAGLGPAWLHLADMHVTDWVADALLAVFFFAAGLELRRELTVGALADRRSAALPVAAAAGGMLAPALICLALTHGVTGGGHAWAIPVATDIAFALGVLTLAGPRAPTGLRTVLLGLAVADDLGGILLIAVGFSHGINPAWLVAAAALLTAVALAHRRRWAAPLLHVPLAAAIWVCVHAAGIHATVAGVALGLLVRVHPDPGEAEAPAARLERCLAPVSAAVVLPVFALSATGVSLAPSALLHVVTDPISRGVAVGLVAGKLLGVPAGAWLAVRLGLARLPDGVRWRHFIPLGLLAGIGYTVSLLIAGLALPDPARTETAATAILTASTVAGALALTALHTRLAAPDAGPAGQTIGRADFRRRPRLAPDRHGRALPAREAPRFPHPESRMATVLAAIPSTKPAAAVHPLPHRVWYYPTTPRSAGAARRNVAAQLHEWKLGELIDPAVLVVSELASNALVASLGAQDQHGDGGAAVSRIAVRLTHSPHDLIVEVWDGVADVPVLRAADPDAENGRGLHLVAALARDSGCYRVRVQNTGGGHHTNGKVAWAILPHATSPVRPVTHAPSDSPALPRRTPEMPVSGNAPGPDAVDVVLLQRVIDGLRALDDWTRDAPPIRSDRPVLPTSNGEALP